jgi:hypothetical protein
MGEVIPLRADETRDAATIAAVESLYAGKPLELPHRKAAALEILADIATLRCTLASWETLVLDRVTRGGFSYSDEDEAARKAKLAAWELFGKVRS